MYTEDRMAAWPYRRQIKDEAQAYLARMQQEADAARAAYFCPSYDSAEAYTADARRYRRDLIALLGKPLTEYDPADVPARARLLPVAEDEFGMIFRLWVEVDEGLHSYGLLFLPRGYGSGERFPLVTALHGGLGTPEIVSSFYNSANYNDMVMHVRRSVRAIVYAPQLMLWSEKYNRTEDDRPENLSFDASFKYLGGSMPAFELFKLFRTLDWITANRDVDPAHIGIVGLSYGGFYTLLAAACDERFRVALSSCSFNDRFAKKPPSLGDWLLPAAGPRFTDAEIASLVCPRALCIQVGIKDELFDIVNAVPRAAEVVTRYTLLGIEDRFRFSPQPGGHQFTPEDVDFLAEHL